MSKAKIFVEGIADVTFLRQYIKHLLGKDSKEKTDIIDCKGWTNIDSEQVVNEMHKNTDNGGINIVIFDADDAPATRRQEINDKARQSDLAIELFLFPNDKDKGALEELLMSITNPQNQPVIDCWDRYEADLQQQTIPWKNPTTPTTPAMKTKVYAYLEALLGESKSQKKLIKETERKYTLANHWDLDSPNLNPLRDFLSSYKNEL